MACKNVLSQAARLRRVGEIWGDDGEFVAAEARHDLAFLQHSGHAVRGRLQDGIAGRVAKEVVDLLEAVEVEAEHGKRAAGDPVLLDLAIEQVVEGGAVRQAGSADRDARGT